jgi:hypothetical protein
MGKHKTRRKKIKKGGRHDLDRDEAAICRQELSELREQNLHLTTEN